MKLIRFFRLTALSLFTAFAFIFSGCENSVSPANSLSDAQPDLNPKAMKFVSIPAVQNSSLNKIVQVSQWVNRAQGGQVQLVSLRNSGEITVTLTVPPFSLESDTEITLRLDDKKLICDVEFSVEPVGVAFNPAASLSISASGVDLSGMEGLGLDIYTLSGDSETWEPVPSEDISINADLGKLDITGGMAQIQSRYGIAGS